MTFPVPPRLPAPPVRDMTNVELGGLVRAGGPYRGKAVFELGDRAATDSEAATLLGELTALDLLREDRVHLISLAWAAIIALLSAGTPHARQVAYRSFAGLTNDDQQDLLDYLRCGRIEEAHPAR